MGVFQSQKYCRLTALLASPWQSFHPPHTQCTHEEQPSLISIINFFGLQSSKVLGNSSFYHSSSVEQSKFLHSLHAILYTKLYNYLQAMTEPLFKIFNVQPCGNVQNLSSQQYPTHYCTALYGMFNMVNKLNSSLNGDWSSSFDQRNCHSMCNTLQHPY